MEQQKKTIGSVLLEVLQQNLEQAAKFLMEFGEDETKSMLANPSDFRNEDIANTMANDIFEKLPKFIEYVRRAEYERAVKELYSQVKVLLFPNEGGYITLSNKYYMPYENIPDNVIVAEFNLDAIPELLKIVNQEKILQYKGIIIDEMCDEEEEEETLALIYDLYQIDDAEDEDGNDIIIPLPPDEEAYENIHVN